MSCKPELHSALALNRAHRSGGACRCRALTVAAPAGAAADERAAAASRREPTVRLGVGYHAHNDITAGAGCGIHDHGEFVLPQLLGGLNDDH